MGATRRIGLLGFTVLVLFGATPAAWAWHVEGRVYCDQNANSVIDAPDSLVSGVGVRVTALVASPGTTYNGTTSGGFYFIALPETDETYRVELVSGLPGGSSVVVPSSGAYGAPPVPAISLHINFRFASNVDFLLSGCNSIVLPTATETPIPTATPTDVTTATPSPTETPVETPTVAGATATPEETVTPTPTDVATATPSPTETPVETPTVAGATATPEGTVTPTPTDVATATPTATPETTATATKSATPTPTKAATATPTKEATVTPTAVSTAAPTPTATASVVPTVTATFTVVPTTSASPTVPVSTATLIPGTPTPGSTPGIFASFFQCYEIDRATLPAIKGLPVEDVFGASSIDIGGRGRVKRLCNPASVDGQNPGGPTDPNHLTGYVVNKRTPKLATMPPQTVTNVFGTIDLKVLRPILFTVPSAKSLVAAPAPLAPAAIDHFQCYAIGSAGKTQVPNLQVVDQFGTLTLDVKRPSRLCVAADKRSEGVLDPAAALMCYGVRASAGTTPFRGIDGPVYIQNQFGPDVLKVTRPTELCVPSVVTPSAFRKPRRGPR